MKISIIHELIVLWHTSCVPNNVKYGIIMVTP